MYVSSTVTQSVCVKYENIERVCVCFCFISPIMAGGGVSEAKTGNLRKFLSAIAESGIYRGVFWEVKGKIKGFI